MNISLIKTSNLSEIHGILDRTTKSLEQKGLMHWTGYYTAGRIKEKMKQGDFYKINDGTLTIGMIHFSDNPPKFFTENTDGPNGSSVNYLSKFPKPDLKALYISAFAILPELQGKGFGTAALKAVENFAKENNYEAIRLDARQTGYDELIRFYERNGFQKISDMPEDEDNYIIFEKNISHI